MKGFVSKCLLKSRGECLFTQAADGTVIATLDSYAVIPVEEYHRLHKANGFVPVYHWPCTECGAEGPTPEGHDPCIANLPGVVHACCGHGCGHAYAKFEDGRVIRGHFDVRAAARSDGQ